MDTGDLILALLVRRDDVSRMKMNTFMIPHRVRDAFLRRKALLRTLLLRIKKMALVTINIRLIANVRFARVALPYRIMRSARNNAVMLLIDRLDKTKRNINGLLLLTQIVGGAKNKRMHLRIMLSKVYQVEDQLIILEELQNRNMICINLIVALMAWLACATLTHLENLILQWFPRSRVIHKMSVIVNDLLQFLIGKFRLTGHVKVLRRTLKIDKGAHPPILITRAGVRLVPCPLALLIISWVKLTNVRFAKSALLNVLGAFPLLPL